MLHLVGLRRSLVRFNRLRRPSRRQKSSGQAEVAPRPETSPRTEAKAG